MIAFIIIFVYAPGLLLLGTLVLEGMKKNDRDTEVEKFRAEMNEIGDENIPLLAEIDLDEINRDDWV